MENFEETNFFFDKCRKSHIIILALGSHYKHFNLNLEDFPSVYKKIKFMAYVLQIIKEKFA